MAYLGYLIGVEEFIELVVQVFEAPRMFVAGFDLLAIWSCDALNLKRSGLYTATKMTMKAITLLVAR